MNTKALLLLVSGLFSYTLLFAKEVVNYRDSDDILFGKQALDRVIARSGTQIKTQPNVQPHQQEFQGNQSDFTKQEYDGLIGALDELDALEIILQKHVVEHVEEKKSEEINPHVKQFDIRYAVEFVKAVAQLELRAQHLFNEALPSVKKRSYGFLPKDLNNATKKIWAEGLAKEMLYHPSFRRLHPDAQNRLGHYLNRLFTSHFRSFMIQRIFDESKANDLFAQLYRTIPESMVTKILKPLYPMLDMSQVLN